MRVKASAAIVGCAAVLAGAGAGSGAAAQTAPDVMTYAVTTIGGSSAGNIVAHETLSLQRSGAHTRLQIAGADGSVFSTPVAYTASGEIASNSQDGAITCYNMAVDAAARTRQGATEPPSVFVRFGTSVVQIPLSVRATQLHGSVRDVALEGRSSGLFRTADATVAAGIVIDAAVEEDGYALRSATFNEVHYAGSPAAVIARSTCILQRVELRPPASTRT